MKALALLAMAGQAAGQDCGDVPDPLPVGRHELTLQFGGSTRQYLVNVPATYDASNPTPLLFTFHGYSNPPDEMCINTGTWRMSEEYGFIAVCPRGNAIDLGWNGGDCCGLAQILGTDDVGFSRAMVSALKDRVCVDEDRVFANGYSNGGYLSYRLACEAKDVFKGIAPVAGSLSGTNRFTCEGPLPPVAHYHGTDDGTIRFQPSLDGWNRYALADECRGGPTDVFRNGTALCFAYDQCRGKEGQAMFCEVQGMGHAWPGCEGTRGSGAGCGGGVNDDISASEDAWKFLNDAIGRGSRWVTPRAGFNTTAGWARVLAEAEALRAKGAMEEGDFVQQRDRHLRGQ